MASASAIHPLPAPRGEALSKHRPAGRRRRAARLHLTARQLPSVAEVSVYTLLGAGIASAVFVIGGRPIWHVAAVLAGAVAIIIAVALAARRPPSEPVIPAPAENAEPLPYEPVAERDEPLTQHVDRASEWHHDEPPEHWSSSSETTKPIQPAEPAAGLSNADERPSGRAARRGRRRRH